MSTYYDMSGLNDCNIPNKFSDESTAATNLTSTAPTKLNIVSQYHTNEPGSEDVKPLIFRSPTQTSAYSNFGVNSENLVINPTETDDPLYIQKNKESVPLSQDCLPDKEKSIEEKADYPSNNLSCMQSSSSFEQNQFNKSNSLSSPTCNTEDHLDKLNSTSSTSSICKTQLKHGDMSTIESIKQPTDTSSKFQASTYNNDKENMICPCCQKKFLRKTYLRKHLKLHMNKKSQYACHIPECGRIFHQKGHLNKHLYGYEKRAVCLLCNRELLCRGSWVAHLEYHKNLKRNEPEDVNNDNSQALRSISPSTSLVPTTYNSSDNLNLCDNANIRSITIRPNIQLLIPAATSEINLSPAGPVNNESQFNNPDNIVSASVDTSKAQFSGRDSLPSMPISTALLSLNDVLLLEAENSQSTRCEKDSLGRHIEIHKKPKQKTKCPCLNCEVEGDSKIKDSKGRVLHVCHITRCGKIFNLPESFRRHLAIHNGKKKYFCSECNKRFIRKDHLKKHVKIHVSAMRNIFSNI